MIGAEKPRIVVVMPHYGQVEAGAMEAFVGAESRTVDVVARIRACTSCTPRAFNTCLIHALNARDHGVKRNDETVHATHMAMIHADVVPQRADWLDVLYREMRVHNLDLVSSVIPIKDPNPHRTSTAIGKTDNPWQIDRYIEPRHYGQIPETFTADDVCGNDEELLVNTGLFLADLRAKWWDTFGGFVFHNRIIRTEDGNRLEQFRPEDWELSRHIRKAGGRYAATWAVPVAHVGSFSWNNR
jgi:hypothetical protein